MRVRSGVRGLDVKCVTAEGLSLGLLVLHRKKPSAFQSDYGKGVELSYFFMHCCVLHCRGLQVAAKMRRWKWCLHSSV